jgi:hypothetical protein
MTWRESEAVRQAGQSVKGNRSGGGGKIGTNSGLQDAVESAFVHITLQHVVSCPYLKTTDDNVFISGVGKED